MWLTRRHLLLSAATILAVLGGCTASPKAVTYLGHADLKYYKDLATKIDYPVECQNDNPTALASKPPREIRHPEKEVIWDLSLNQAIQIALQNNRIIRTRDQALFNRNPLVQNPEQSPSVFDPALQETGILYNQRGVEAALSDFDAMLSLSFTGGHSTQAENNAGLSGLPTPAPGQVPVLSEDTSTFRARLDKYFADSSEFSLINEWDYTRTNEIASLFPSDYTGFARAEFRRPLLAGAGADYTRIAGPISKNYLGVAQGVVISRINNDMAIADFEAAVHNLIRDVQTAYWDLALNYYTFRAEKLQHTSVLKTWRLVKSKTATGLAGGSSADEAQARDTFFDNQGRVQEALGNLYISEGALRRLLGLPVNDGRVIRPCDEPAVAEFIPDWHIAVAKALALRPEIRKEKWNIKSQELQLSAAKSQLLPRLDFVAGGQINAFGNTLVSSQSILAEPGSSAFASLAEAQQTAWNVGFEASIPIGFRLAHSQVRNLELRVAHARAALATQELDVSHEVREAFQNMDRTYAITQSTFNRLAAAKERVGAYEAQYELRGSSTVDPLLRAEQSEVQAEVAYFQSLIQYNQAITNYYYRTGTILEESNISISEDMWDPRAYHDALRRASARSHAVDNPYLRTAPAEFVIPPGAPNRAAMMAGVPATIPPDISTLIPPPGGAPYGGAPPMSPSGPPAAMPPAGPTPSRPIPPQRNESEPAVPLPTPKGLPVGFPEAAFGSVVQPSQTIMPASASDANFQMPGSSRGGMVEPATFNSPQSVIPSVNRTPPMAPLSGPPSGPASESGFDGSMQFRAASAASDATAAPTQFAAPVVRPASPARTPQPGTFITPAADSFDNSSAPSADAFDMPLNQK